MNNVSATSSTQFVQHHLSKSPVLRPLTMVLKQWLFQRKMNEVYTRGGLSSYALFLLVLTIVQQHNFASVCPPDEAIGRYLLQFLRQWGAPTAFAEMIRPLRGPIEKSGLSWEDTYQPFSLCRPSNHVLTLGIQDPVNEQNFIGRQTFSIREIQQEWQLSLNALSVAIDEYAMNINGGRERSLLASIVGLTTRCCPKPLC
jgi:non-canonical poly(A) RNA polymerase PAPD5/7